MQAGVAASSLCRHFVQLGSGDVRREANVLLLCWEMARVRAWREIMRAEDLQWA